MTSSFTVASGPINFGTFGASATTQDQDIFGAFLDEPKERISFPQSPGNAFSSQTAAVNFPGDSFVATKPAMASDVPFTVTPFPASYRNATSAPSADFPAPIATHYESLATPSANATWHDDSVAGPMVVGRAAPAEYTTNDQINYATEERMIASYAVAPADKLLRTAFGAQGDADDNDAWMYEHTNKTEGESDGPMPEVPSQDSHDIQQFESFALDSSYVVPNESNGIPLAAGSGAEVTFPQGVQTSSFSHEHHHREPSMDLLPALPTGPSSSKHQAPVEGDALPIDQWLLAPQPPPIWTQKPHETTLHEDQPQQQGPRKGSVSGISSAASSPLSIKQSKVEAGRRKLEEYKRKKQAALAKKAGGSSSFGSEPSTSMPSETSVATGAQHGSITRILPPQPLLATSSLAFNAAPTQQIRFSDEVANERQREEGVVPSADLERAMQRAVAAESAAAELSQDLNQVLRQLEAVDAERCALQREKAAMVGELIALRSASEHADDLTRARNEAEEEVGAARAEVEALLARVRDLEGAITAEREQAAATVAQAHASLAEHTEYAGQAQQWIEVAQAEAEAVRSENQRFLSEISEAKEGLEIERGLRALAEERLTTALEDLDSVKELLEDGAEERRRLVGELQDARAGLESLAQEKAQLLQSVHEQQNQEGEEEGRHKHESAKGGDVESLRYRLSRAENAVEKERRVAQALERRIRDAEAEAAEGRASTAAAFELRRRCDAAEREVATLKLELEHLRAASASLPDAQAQALASIRDAEERAGAAVAASADLRAQCDAAARTISKLMEENQGLVDRLNRQADELGRLVEMEVIRASSSGQAGGQYDAAHDMPPMWNIPGARPVVFDSNGEIVPAPTADPEVTGRAEDVNRGGRGGHVANRPKSGGWWAWLAGADLVDTDES